MSVEAMWSVKFVANNQNAGGGVVVLESGRVFGGDSGFLYHGHYDCKNGKLNARVRVRRHYHAVIENVFGIDDFTLVVEGDLGESEFILDGVVEQDPSRKIRVLFKREEELP